MPDLSIIIVNWNTRELLLECLASITGNLKGIGYEAIVVDNGSQDASAEVVGERYPAVKVIRNSENTGFARAVNQGIKEAQGRYYLVLNSDARLTPGDLEAMVKFMDATPTAGLAGAQLINPDGSLQNSFDNIPDLATTLFNKSLLRWLLPKKYPSKNAAGQPVVPFEVASVVGAAMLIRPEAVKQVGTFDEDYFLFLEETDLCLRLRQAGWKIVIIPEARVYHRQGETKKRLLIRAKIEYLVSLYKFFRKRKPTVIYGLLRFLYPLRLFLQLVFVGLGCVLTLGLVPVVRRQCYGYSCLLFWHLAGCPRGWTLRYRKS